MLIVKFDDNFLLQRFQFNTNINLNSVHIIHLDIVQQNHIKKFKKEESETSKKQELKNVNYLMYTLQNIC